MRKTAMIPIKEAGRDKGKVFLITEMSAEQGEDWAMRVLLALMQSNVQVPEGFLELGMAGLAEMGLKALSGITWGLAKPLMEELMSCITIIPDSRKTHVSRSLVPDDIEEIATRAKLKWEVLHLHVDFSKAADLSALAQDALKAAKRHIGTKTSPS